MVYFLQNLDMPFGGFLVKTYCSRHSTMFSFNSLQLLTSRLSFNTVEEEDKVDGEERGVVAVVGLVGLVIKVGLVDGFIGVAVDIFIGVGGILIEPIALIGVGGIPIDVDAADIIDDDALPALLSSLAVDLTAKNPADT